MMQGQRPYIPMQRPMRGATRSMYSSPPQAHSQMQGYLPPQQNIPFQMMGQVGFDLSLKVIKPWCELYAWK